MPISIEEKRPPFEFTSTEHQQVKDFLDKCHLPQYYATFIDEGFESLQAVLEITEDDLIALNVKRGHRRVIQRGIATLNGVPKNQPLHMMSSSTSIPNGIPPSTISTSRSKSHNNNGNHSSEGSSGTYTTSGYGSMSSPRHPTSNTSSMSKPYEFPPSTPSYTTTSSSNNNDTINTPPSVNIVGTEHPASHQHQLVHILHQNTADSESHDMMDATQKESRSSYSSNEDEDEDMVEEEQSNNGNSSATSSPLKRKYRRHPKPDKHAPIKPPSAYIMFSNDARAQLKGHNMTFVEIAKIVGDQWKNLGINQKQQYERTAMRAKDEYIDALNEYRKTNEYKEYQKYLTNFKAEQDATNRKIARLRKRAKRSSPGSLADSSSNGNDKTSSNGSCESHSYSMHADNARSSSSSGGSTDIYKVHRKIHANTKGSSSEEGSVLRSMDTTPTIEVSTSTTPPDEEVDDDDVDDNENDMEECYSPQQKAPPLISDNMAKSNYHRLPFNEGPRQQ
ncbi:hypothetical protein MBANPS3_005960 [Mucor bainieri]